MIYTYKSKVTVLPISQKAKNIMLEHDVTTIRMFMDSTLQVLKRVQIIELVTYQEILDVFNMLHEGTQYRDRVIVSYVMANEYKKYWRDEYLQETSLPKAYANALCDGGVRLFSELLLLTKSDLLKFKTIGNAAALKIIEFRREHWQNMKPIDRRDTLYEIFFVTDAYDEVIYAVSHVIELNKKKLIYSTDAAFPSETPDVTVSAKDKDLINAPDFARIIANSEYVFTEIYKIMVTKVKDTNGGMTKEMVTDLIPPLFRYKGYVNSLLHVACMSVFKCNDAGYYKFKY